MISTEEAYKLAVQRHLPKQIRAQRDEYFRSGNFKMYRLTENLFFNKDPMIKAAAQKELDELIAWAEDPNSP